jgi:hypothetical protein
MIFLDEIEVEKIVVKFWKGIDIEKISKHPKDGSDGFMIVLFDSIRQEKIDYKLSAILDDSKVDFEIFINTVNNPYVMIYQSGVNLSTDDFKVASLYN